MGAAWSGSGKVGAVSSSVVCVMHAFPGISPYIARQAWISAEFTRSLALNGIKSIVDNGAVKLDKIENVFNAILLYIIPEVLLKLTVVGILFGNYVYFPLKVS